MDELETRGDANLASEPKPIGSCIRRSGVYVFLISCTSLYYLASAPLLLGHYDLGWHLAAGDLIRSQGHVPFGDPWSFTAGNRQWYNLSWLWDATASALFQYTSFSGLLFSVIAGGAVIVAMLASICLRSGASATAVCASVLPACLLYPAFAAYPSIYLAASPNISTMLFCVLFYAVCLNRTRWFLLPVMMVLWVNLHGGFPLGFLIIGIFGGAAILKRDWAGFKFFCLSALGCAVVIPINPLGWHVYAALQTVLGHFSQEYVTEWLPYYLNISLPESIPGIVYILIFVALELRDRGPVPLEPRLLSWFFLALGLYQFRYIAFFFMFSTLPLALHIDRLLLKRPESFKAGRSLLAAGILVACALPLAYLHVKPALGLPQMLSQQDVDYLQTHFPRARLLNHWNYGGLLIFRSHGAIPVFVDGRAATAYPDDLLRDYFKLAELEFSETAWDAALEKYQIDTVLWVKAHEDLRRFLVGKRGWKEAYTGLYASIYIKP
jgi:hypothetical protein